MFTVRLKHVNKGKQCEKLKQSSFLFCPICISVLFNPVLFVGHFSAEELRHVCCRMSCTPGSPTWLVRACISFPPGGRSSQAAPRAVQTLPSAAVPYTAGLAAGWMVVFLVTGSYDVGRSNVFQRCLSSSNYCDGHLGTADWRSWVLIGGT